MIADPRRAGRHSDDETVSVIIPVHNGEQFVADAIRSALAQTAPAAECIVIDDGSTDGTQAVIESFGTAVRYERKENSGVSETRNRGVELAHGKFVAFLDHDDAWLPRKLELQLDEFHHSGAAMILCGMLVVDASGEPIGHKRLSSPGDLLRGLLTFDGTESVSCSSTGLIERRQFEALGGFDPNLGTSADLDLLIRVLLTGSIGYVEEELVRYRVHAKNMSRNISAMERDMIHLLGKVFEDPHLPDNVHDCRRRAYGATYRMLSGSYLGAGDRTSALRTLAAALRSDPTLLLQESRRRYGRLVDGGRD